MQINRITAQKIKSIENFYLANEQKTKFYIFNILRLSFVIEHISYILFAFTIIIFIFLFGNSIRHFLSGMILCHAATIDILCLLLAQMGTEETNHVHQLTDYDV